MPFLRDEARKLAEPTRESGVVSVFYEFGDKTLIRALPYKETRGTEHKWTIQSRRAQGSSAADKYGTTTASGGAQKRNVKVETAMYRRDAKTAIAADVELSEYNEQRALDEYDETQALAFDYGYDLFQGMGAFNRMHGHAFYATLYNGVVDADGNKKQIITMGDTTFPTFNDRIFWNTDDGTPTGTPQTLNLPVLTDLFTRNGDGQPYEMAFMSREARNAIYHLIAAGSGGSMVDTYFSRFFNQEVLRYQGLELIRNDNVGAQKGGEAPYGISGAAGSDTITVDSPAPDDDQWVGFSALDVGREIIIDGNTHTIQDLGDDIREAIIDPVIPAGDYAGESFTLPKHNVIVATRMHEMNGWCGLYSDMGQYSEGGSSMMYGGAEPIAGIAARDVGVLQTGGRFAVTQFDLLHTTKACSPWVFATLCGFEIPDVV